MSNKNQPAVADALNALLADSFALYLKTKNYHWHVKGPSFRARMARRRSAQSATSAVTSRSRTTTQRASMQKR